MQKLAQGRVTERRRVIDHARAVGARHVADRLRDALAEQDIQSRGYYRTPIHRQPAMARYAPGLELPITEELARTNLALPMSPVLRADQVNEVVAAIAGFET